MKAESGEPRQLHFLRPRNNLGAGPPVPAPQTRVPLPEHSCLAEHPSRPPRGTEQTPSPVTLWRGVARLPDSLAALRSVTGPWPAPHSGNAAHLLPGPRSPSANLLPPGLRAQLRHPQPEESLPSSPRRLTGRSVRGLHGFPELLQAEPLPGHLPRRPPWVTSLPDT